jgi:hypothetical protein
VFSHPNQPGYRAMSTAVDGGVAIITLGRIPRDPTSAWAT